MVEHVWVKSIYTITAVRYWVERSGSIMITSRNKLRGDHIEQTKKVVDNDCIMGEMVGVNELKNS